MAAITESELRDYVGRHVTGSLGRQQRMTKRADARSVFLSHSSKDKELALLVVQALKKVNIDVYVDWLDDGLPNEVSVETARILRDKIRDNDRLLLLATNNALASRWVPWELGFADGRKSENRVAILEVRRDSETYHGNEYVDLYPKLNLPLRETRNWLTQAVTARSVDAATWLR